jgi:hypothetical protein
MKFSWRVVTFLIGVSLFSTGCIGPLMASLMGTASTEMTGTLEVDIDYTDTWYRETFNYARDAENIRHVVLVMPLNESENILAGQVFSRLAFPPEEGAEDPYGWALDYIYDAPDGYFTGGFPPGTYALAAAFLANPLSREEAGVGEDVILWAGVTGGGASTDFQTVEIEQGETTSVTIGMDDSDGWACPWLYVFNGQTFERRVEILRNIRGKEQQYTETTFIGPVTIIDGSAVIKVVEEKDEISYIDALYLEIDGVKISAQPESAAAAQIAEIDGDYLILHRGESREFRFVVPSASSGQQSVSVVATGYYTSVE